MHEQLDLHLGVGDRGPPRQDGRPDQRRRPRRHPRAGPAEPRRVRDARAPPAWSSSPARSPPRPTSTSQRIVRDTIRGIGYTESAYGFDGNTCGVITSIDEQSPDIAQGVDKSEGGPRRHSADHYDEVGRRRPGDDVRLRLRRDRRPHADADLARAPPRRAAGRGAQGRALLDYLRPDGKTQVTHRLRGRQAGAAAHGADLDASTRPASTSTARSAPTSSSTSSGPSCPSSSPTTTTRCSSTRPARSSSAARTPTAGSPAARSSSTPTAAWPATVAARSAARTRRRSTARPRTRSAGWPRTSSPSGIAPRCEVQVAYAIGVAHPVSMMVETFGTAEVDPAKLPEPRAARCSTCAPRRSSSASTCAARSTATTAAYGHFGRERPRLHVGAHRPRRRAARRPAEARSPDRRGSRPDVPVDAIDVVRLLTAVPACSLPVRPAAVRVGTIVRVPLHGRRVRGLGGRRRRRRARDGDRAPRRCSRSVGAGRRPTSSSCAGGRRGGGRARWRRFLRAASAPNVVAAGRRRSRSSRRGVPGALGAARASSSS